MTRGFLSDVLAKWKRFRWQGLVKVWAVFMAIALVLLVESLGVHYGATRMPVAYSNSRIATSRWRSAISLARSALRPRAE